MTTRRTLLLAVAYVLLLAVVAFGLPLAISLRDRVDAEVRGQATSQADLLAASAPELLGRADRQTLDRLVETSAASVRGRVVVVNRAGRLIADSTGGGEIGGDFSTRPEIAAALTGSTYQETRHSDTLQTDILATAVPILHRGAVVGAVRITQSVAAVNDAVRRSVIGIVLLGLAVLALGVVAGALIAQRIARPIRRLADAADEVAAGDLDAAGAGRGHQRAAVAGTELQRDDRPGRADARQPARVRRRLLPPAADAADRAAPAARGGRAPRRLGGGARGGPRRPPRGRPAGGDRRGAARPQPRRRA